MKPTLTTAEVAAKLGVTRETVLNRMRAGHLTPVAKLPTKTGPYLFDPDDVEALLSTEPESAA